MPPFRPPSRINHKVSTMPRQQSEAAQYLNAYKLTIEKKRLQQELDSLAQRRDRIQKRLDILEHQLEEIEIQARESRMASTPAKMTASAPNSIIYHPIGAGNSSSSEGFKTVTLDY